MNEGLAPGFSMSFDPPPGREELFACALALFNALEDIDTVDDMAKGDDRAYRSMVQAIVRRRWDHARPDENGDVRWHSV